MATVPLTTPGDCWATGKLLGKCHRFLRWGHAGPLSESSLAFCAFGLEPSLQRLWLGAMPDPVWVDDVCQAFFPVVAIRFLLGIDPTCLRASERVFCHPTMGCVSDIAWPA